MLWQGTFNADATLVAFPQEGRQVVICETASGRLRRTFRSRSRVATAAFHPAADRLIAATGETAIVWSSRGPVKASRLDGHFLHTTCAALSADGKFAATGSFDKSVCLWSVRTGRRLLSLEDHEAAVTSVAVSPDGRMVASGALNGGVRLWRVTDGMMLAAWHHHTDRVSHVVFSHEGDRLATCSFDRTICIHHLARRKRVVRLTGHTDWVRSGSFDSAGEIVLTASEDGTARLWDPGTGHCRKVFGGVESPLLCVALAPASSQVVALGTDARIIRWRLDAPSSTRTESVLGRGDAARVAIGWACQRLRDMDMDSPRLAAEMLTAHALQVDRQRLRQRLDRALTGQQARRLRDAVRRARRNEPINYITGEREFYGLDFRVSPSVLTPRSATETFIDTILADVRRVSGPRGPATRRLRLADVCTGSGCIGLTLLKVLPRSLCTCVDISEAALRVARVNSRRLGLSDRVRFIHGNLLGPLLSDPKCRSLDYLVSNPPYIPSRAMATLPAGIRDYEPHLALVAGDDGLDLIRPLIAGAPRLLKPGGKLIVELWETHRRQALALASNTPGLTDAAIVNDCQGFPIFLMAQRCS